MCYIQGVEKYKLLELSMGDTFIYEGFKYTLSEDGYYSHSEGSTVNFEDQSIEVELIK